MKTDIAIIGAGIAGLTCAQRLRELGYPGSITLISDEPGFPYKRTHLTKQLYRPLAAGEFATQTQQSLDAVHISFRGNTSIDRLDLENRVLHTMADAESIAFDQLVLATGARPRKSPVLDHGYPVYRESQVLQLQTALDKHPNEEVHILGGGILGVELAEQLTRRGRKVHLYSNHPHPMAREIAPELGLRLKKILQSKGVTILPDSAFPFRNPPALTVLALGVQPDVRLALTSGLDCDRGILVNQFMETSHPGVYAVGDCAQLPDGSVSHLWHQAEDQGRYCAQRIMGSDQMIASLPFRTKAEVFGNLIFSCGSITGSTAGDSFVQGDAISLWIRLQDNRAVGLAFIGERDKSLAKLGQNAVREGWSLERITELITEQFR